MKDSIKYIWWMWEDLTGSSTLLKLSWKDSLSVVIDYWLHQWWEWDNELNNMTDSDVLKADFVIITHAHMDHIWRLPMLINKWFKWRIIMTSMTKELASLMLINNVTLTTDQIKQVWLLNNKKANKLKEYLKILSINKRLKDNNLKKDLKLSLEKERDKLLKGSNLEKLLKESIDFLQSLNVDIDLAKLLTRKQANNLLDIEDEIIEILEKRESRIDRNKLDFDRFLNLVVDLERKLKKWDNSSEILEEIDKYKSMIALYYVEMEEKLSEKVWVSINHSKETKSLLILQQNIIKDVLENYSIEKVKSKTDDYKNEQKFIDTLIKKRDHIIWDKDLELCVEYSKKILRKNVDLKDESWKKDDFKKIKSDIPTLLYDTQMVYKTLESIETLEPWEEMELESRMVINKLDSDVICRIPQIIKDWYSKKIYVNHKIITWVVAKWNKEYNYVVEKNRKNKQLRNTFEKANKFVNRYEKAKDKFKIIVPEGKTLEWYYIEQKKILESSEIYKLQLELKHLFSVHKNYLERKDKYNNIKDKNINFFNSSILDIKSKIDELNIINLDSDEYILSDLIKFFNEYEKYLKYYDNENNKNKKEIDFYEWYSKCSDELKELSITSIDDLETINISNSINKFKILSKVEFTDNEVSSVDEDYIYNLSLSDIDNILWGELKLFIDIELKSKFIKKINSLIKIRNKNIINDKEEKKRLITIFNKVEFYKHNKMFLDKIFSLDYDFLWYLINIEKSIDLLLNELKNIQKNKYLYLEYLDFEKSKPFFKSQKDKLDEYGISTFEDISRFISERYWVLDLPFTKKEIDKAKSRLVPTFEKENQRTIEKVTLKFFNAWHVEWSIMASISLITKKVKDILNNIPHKVNDRWFENINKPIKEHINLLFTWDMWKIKDSNISWTPDIPDHRYDYVQFESTYAARNHPDKEKEFSKFIYELNAWYWNKLIPAFSFQRTQEILVELIQNKFDNIELLKKYPILKSKLKKLNKDFKHILDSDVSDLDETEKKLRIEKFLEKTELEEELIEIKNTVFLWTIVVDSPLAMKIWEVFLRKYPEKYKFLDLEYQKSVFWKPVMKVLKQWEYKNLYKWNTRNSWYVILSSWWMIQWWAIINHVKEIISDKNAKIIFTWYQAKNTLGWKIVNKDSSVIIDWDSYEVKAKIVSIWWYSSHIQKDDIIDFVTSKLKLSKNSTLASTHWTSDRIELVESILSVNNKLNIIIPEVWNTKRFDFLKN